MKRTVGWTFMSTEPETYLRKTDLDDCWCFILENQHRHGGHKCPPYGATNEPVC